MELNREIPNWRPKACDNIHYDIDTLPTVSIIVPFHNEARSTLLRTMHSILLRSPDKLLKEIIMVDDASTFDWLKDPLTDYVAHFPKVTVLRLGDTPRVDPSKTCRGTDHAKGETLFFMDSHSEVNTGWLEPILQKIKENRTNVIIPTMDIINWEKFSYLRAFDNWHGSFNWVMDYTWKRNTTP